MKGVSKKVENLLDSIYSLRTLSDLIGETKVSAENREELEDVVGMLEIHEHEIRRLRQSLNLRLRLYSLDHYRHHLEKKAYERTQ